MRHEIRHLDDGRVLLPTLAVTLKKLIRHAQRFGTEEVFETAEADGFDPKTLALLRVELDRIDGTLRPVDRPHRRRRTEAEAVLAAVELRNAGLVIPAIADRLHVSDARARHLLRLGQEASLAEAA
jgi:hypothetical protein